MGAGSGPSSNRMPTLEEYGTNLTTQATEASRLNHLIGTWSILSQPPKTQTPSCDYGTAGVELRHFSACESLAFLALAAVQTSR